VKPRDRQLEKDAQSQVQGISVRELLPHERAVFISVSRTLPSCRRLRGSEMNVLHLDIGNQYWFWAEKI
jgi:hypothetical protein